MSVASAGSLSLRFALRQMRGGLRGFYVFLACIALGVMAIAGVGSFAGSLTDGIARQGSFLLGGDASFLLIHREAEPRERAFLEQQGEVSGVATLRAMARAGDSAALVELKAVDDVYPLYGTIALEPDMPLAKALAAQDGAFGVVADSALVARLGLKTGDRLSVGDARLELRGTIRSEPDKLAAGIGFGPRLMMSVDALRATNLLQPGSLVRWHYRVRLPDNSASDSAAEAVADRVRAQLPQAGWEIRTRNNASPALERNIERFTQFLTVVGLTVLLVGGVGVANAVKGHLDRTRDTIAVMKAVGASGGRVFTIYLVQVLLLALIGAACGLAAGAVLPFLVKWTIGAILPLPVEPNLHPLTLAIALLYGLVTAFAFALWPLGRAHDVPVSALFRAETGGTRRFPRAVYVGATILAGLMLAFLVVGFAYDRKIAVAFVLSACAVFVFLRIVAWIAMAIARRLPHPSFPSLRLALANIHRPGALTPTVVLSLGLGVTVLVTVIEIDGNLRAQFMAALPDKAPSFYFLDIGSSDGARFDAFVKAQAPDAKLERVPMLRGRIVSINDVKAEDLKPTPDTAWALQSDRGLSYTGEIPPGSRVVAGEWWGPDYKGPPLMSFEKRIADGLGAKIGDMVTVNVLGRNITARIANLRAVDWQSLGINFVLVYSPGILSGAPHTHIATLTYPDGGNPAREQALLKQVADAFPGVTSIRVKDALDAVGGIVTNLVLAIRIASLITLVSAILVLGGALAASHRARVYDAVIMKTLGATRARLIGAYALEYLMVGLATALFGAAAGSAAAWMIVTQLMTLKFTFLPLPAALAALGALLVTVTFGLLGTVSALGQKPAGVLRNL
ncbi:MAG: ABC transporter permease [Pseudorhodoplanes sp.]